MKNYSVTLLLLIALVGSAFSQAFVHPGILHTQEDFDRMAQKVNANEQPWKGSYDLLVASSEAQLSWNPRATATVIRGGSGDNVSLLYRDVQAAYQYALIYKITGNTAHGDKARDILNAWSSTHTLLSGNADRYLASGLFGYQFANAAEMMRGYSGFNVAQFQNYLLDVYYYPLVERFLIGNSHGADHNDACITNYWANWDLANMAAMIAIGVFCDNRSIYNQGIEYFKNGAGNGSITHAVPFVHSSTMAQWQESGRDQGHTILGIGLMASFCEIAWNQGDDMYGWDDSRFRKAANYVAAYNNGQSVPFSTYSWGSGQNCAYNEHTGISSAGRGEVRPVWEMIYNHYANRVGQASLIPWVAQEAADLRPEGGPGGHATTYDQPGFGSLTHYTDPGSCSPTSITPYLQVNGGSWQNTTSVTINSGDQIKFGPQPVSGGSWSWSGCGTAGSSREQTVSPTSNCNATATYTNSCGTTNSVTFNITVTGSGGGATYYQLQNRGTGLVLDGYGRTANGDDCAQYASSTNHVNSHWEMISAGSNYYLQNRGTGLRLDGMGRTSNGANVGQYANSTTSANAQWSVQQYDGNYYRIQNVGTGLYLDGMGRTANGDACGQWANTTSNNAQWELIPVSSGARMGASQVSEELAETEIRFYPNPVSSVLTLKLPEEFATGEVKVFDLSGKLALETRLSIENPQVNVAALEPGVYVLQITGEDTKEWSKKFIKVKE